MEWVPSHRQESEARNVQGREQIQRNGEVDLQGCAAAKSLAALAGKVCLAVAGKFPIIPKGYSGLVQKKLSRHIGGIMGNYGELWGKLGGYMGNYGGIMGNYGEFIYGDLWAIMVKL